MWLRALEAGPCLAAQVAAAAAPPALAAAGGGPGQQHPLAATANDVVARRCRRYVSGDVLSGLAFRDPGTFGVLQPLRPVSCFYGFPGGGPGSMERRAELLEAMALRAHDPDWVLQHAAALRQRISPPDHPARALLPAVEALLGEVQQAAQRADRPAAPAEPLLAPLPELACKVDLAQALAVQEEERQVIGVLVSDGRPGGGQVPAQLAFMRTSAAAAPPAGDGQALLERFNTLAATLERDPSARKPELDHVEPCTLLLPGTLRSCSLVPTPRCGWRHFILWR